MFGDLSLDVFQEDALLMNSAVVLPLVAQYGTVNPLIDGPEEGNCNYGSFGTCLAWIRLLLDHIAVKPQGLEP